MKINKKVVFIAVAAVLVLGATLGAVAIVQANDQGTSPALTAYPAHSANISMFEKIGTIYKANTGTTIDAAQLQKAFTQAQQELATQARDTMLQKLVTDGKITPKQAEDYKTWLNSEPSTIVSDQYKKWLESKPQGIPFGPGMGGPAMPRGFGGMGKMPGR